MNIWTSIKGASPLLAIMVVAMGCGGEGQDGRPPIAPSPPPVAASPRPQADMPSALVPSAAPVTSAQPPEEAKGPIAIVEEQKPGPRGLALVGSSLIWLREKQVRGLALPDGKPTDLGASRYSGTVRPVSDGQSLYWFSGGFADIFTMPLAGGAVKSVAVKLPAGMKTLSPSAIDVNATSILVLHDEDKKVALLSIPKSDGSSTVLARVPSAVCVVGCRIVPDGDDIFWSSAGQKIAGKEISPAIYRYSTTTKKNEQLLELVPGVLFLGLASDKESVYVSVGGMGIDGWIGALSKRTGRRTVLAEHVKGTFFALDGEFVYFTSQDDKTVSRVRKSGGAPEVLWRGSDRPDDVVVDDRYVYWLNYTNMSIMRLRKP